MAVQRCSRHHWLRSAADLLEGFRNHEGQFQRLVGIQTWVTVGMVAVAQAGLGNRSRTPNALSHVLAGHLDMNAARVTAFGLMHLEELTNFR